MSGKTVNKPDHILRGLFLVTIAAALGVVYLSKQGIAGLSWCPLRRLGFPAL
jgi:hypothetical protein